MEQSQASHPDDAYRPLVQPNIPMPISLMQTAEVASKAHVSTH
jgi:hypothetical protein